VSSIGGDIFLDLDRTKYFLPGLLCFLIGHILYIASFYKGARWDKKRIPYALIVLSLAAPMVFFLAKSAGTYLIPVISYIAVITLMALVACFHKKGFPFLIVGAFIYMISDSLIGINKFVYPILGAQYFILFTYYLGQGLLTLGTVRSQK